MGADLTYDDFGPGLHVLREADPLKRAGSMAAQLHAELCATLPQADATLAERSGLPPIDATTLATLQALARRVARAERLVARTLDRATAQLGQRLAGGTGIAVHPSTIRERAAAVTAARAALTAAEAALAAHEEALAPADTTSDAAPADGSGTTVGAMAAPPAEADPAVEAEGTADVEPAPSPRGRSASPRARRSQALGAVVGAFGLALVLLGLGVLALWAALIIPLAAALWALRHLQPRDGGDDERSAAQEVSERLAEVAAATDQVFGARQADQELADREALLRASRDRAQEEVRVAERAWHDLAGADSEVAEVEAVVARFDPQHEDARALAGETPGVRAAETVLHQFRQRWLAFWRELGLPAPDGADGERAVAELAGRVSRPIVLVGPALARGSDLARVAPAAPVVELHGPGDEAGASLS